MPAPPEAAGPVIANDLVKTAAFENYPVNLLTKGSLVPTSVTNGTFIATTISTADFDELTLEAKLAAGAADTDLKVEVFPVDFQGNVLYTPMTADKVSGPKFDSPSSSVSYWGVFDVSGQNAVYVRITNNAATPKNISYSYHLD